MFRPFQQRRRRCARAGFSLVEIMVVVLIISVLAALSVPIMARIKRKAKTSVLVNDFRAFAGAFENYAQEFGTFPAEAAAGVFPTGMDDRINRTAWARTTPMGGKYNWENNQLHFGTRYQAAIAISAVAGAPLPLDVTQLQDLERTFDSTFDWLGGTFHLGTGLVPLVIVQP